MSNKKRGVGEHNTVSNQIEKMVRRKNLTYRKWRDGYTFPTLDNWATECMFRFDKLPAWERYVQACRRHNYNEITRISVQHREWKAEVRKWCLEKQITTYPNQSAQFLKFYFAWYRWQHEQRNGRIERMYGRQMQ